MMPLAMIDLVAKARGSTVKMTINRNDAGLYKYKGTFRTLHELAKIGNIASSTLYSRLQLNTFNTIEDAVHAPVRDNRKKG